MVIGGRSMKSFSLITLIAAVLLLAGCTGEVVSPQSPTGLLVSTPQDANYTENGAPEFLEIPGNRTNETTPAPEFQGIEYTLTFREGDLVEVNPVVEDPDGDRVFLSFSEPLNREGRWQTRLGDAGEYIVTITASDGELETQESVLLIIERANRPPVIECQERAVLREGEYFNVRDYCEFYDPDGDDIVIHYAGWPGRSLYRTTFDDAGNYTLTIFATDGVHNVEHQLPITVLNVNRPPEFPSDFPTRVTGQEGDVFTIDVSGVTNPDGDPLTFTFSEPFNNRGVWRSSLGDAGTYNVDVVASDGIATVRKTLTVEVQLANTPPVLRHIPDITVHEGETIRLPIHATDREGDELTITVSGWMNSDTKETTFGDAGEYTVTVTVSDGVHEVSQNVHVTVLRVNRPPVFIDVQ